MKTWFKRFVLIVLLVVSPCAFAQFGVSVLTNNSGGSLAQGSVIVVDSSADKSFTTTTSERATNTIGVVFKSTGIANGATGLILLQGSYVEVVLTTGVISRGDFLITSTTAGRAKSGGTTNTGAIFGFAITASGGGESSVSAILVSNATAAGLMLEDDEFLIYGTDTDFKIGFVSATSALSWLDGDDNTLMTLADGGTVGNATITGTLNVDEAVTFDTTLNVTGTLTVGATTGVQIITVDSTNDIAILEMDGATNGRIQFRENGSARWRIYSNASDDSLRIYDDAQNFDVLTFSAATGAIEHAKGDFFWTGDGSGIPFGSMYNDNTDTTVTMGTSGTAVRIPSGFTAGQTNLVTFQNNREQVVTKAGRYKISWSISFNTIAGANQEIEGHIGVDNAEVGPGSAHRFIGTASDKGNMGGNAILDLAASAVISLMLVNDTGTNNINVNHADLVLTMVGGT